MQPGSVQKVQDAIVALFKQRQIQSQGFAPLTALIEKLSSTGSTYRKQDVEATLKQLEVANKVMYRSESGEIHQI